MADRRQYQELVVDTARRYGVPEELAWRMVRQESGFNPNAHSPAGAIGLTQLMPDTARGLGVQDPWDPVQNVEGGMKYLRQQLDRFDWRPDLALAAYNAGPGAVQKHGGIPPYKETQNYVRSILGDSGGRGVQVADSGQSQSDAGPAPLPDGDPEMARRIIERMSGRGSAPQAAPSEAPANAGPAPLPDGDPAMAERIVRRMTERQAQQQAAPAQAPVAEEQPLKEPATVPQMADRFWDNIKQRYGEASDKADHWGRLTANALGQAAVAPIEGIVALERGLQEAAYPPGTVQKGWESLGPGLMPAPGAILASGTPYPITGKAETFPEKVWEFEVPWLAGAGISRAASEYASLVTNPKTVPTLEKVASAGKAMIEGLKGVKKEALTATAGSTLAKALPGALNVDEKEQPLIATALEGVGAVAGAAGVGGLVHVGKNVAKSTFQDLEKSGEGPRRALSYALGQTDEGALQFLPKDVTPDHMAEALRVAANGPLRPDIKLNTAQLMTTPSFRKILTQVSGRTTPISREELNPMLQRAGNFLEVPVTETAKTQVVAARAAQEDAATKQFLAASSKGADLDRLESAAPGLHSLAYTKGKKVMQSTVDDLDRVIRESLGDTKIPDNQVADTVRRTLEASDEVIEKEASRRYGVVRETHGQPIVHPIENIASYRRSNIGFNDRGERKFYEYPESSLSQPTREILKQIDEIGSSPLKNPFNETSGNRPFLMKEQLPEIYGMYNEEAENLYKQINSALRSDLPDLDNRVLNQMKSALMRDREQLVPEAKAFMGEEAFGKYQQDFTDAVSQWKEMKKLQGEKTIQAIQNKQTGGQWDLNAAQVQRNLLASGDSVRSYQELSKMGGVDPDSALREAIASKMDDFMVDTPDGPRLDTRKFDKWQKGNRDMVDALPETVRQDLSRVGESANSYELQRTIRDEGKLKALLGGDPAETKSHKIIRDMLTTGQRGLNQGDFNRLQKATGVERERLSKLLGDSILYQLRTADVDMNPLTQRQQLDALTTNAGFLRSVYKGNPEIEAGIRGLQDLRRAQANLNRIKAGAELTGSNTANKLTESVMTKEKLESSTLGVLASRAGFMIGGGVGVPFIVGGIAVQGLPSRIIDASAKALSKIYLDPLVMAEALQSKNMQEVILNHAEALLPKLLEDSGSAATAAATRAAGSGRFQEGTVD